jgi:hypothetical protein
MKKNETIQVQFAAFEIDTFDSTLMENILGGPVDGKLRDDEQQRKYFQFVTSHVRSVVDTVVLATDKYYSDNKPRNPDLLTIFAAPEFLFKDRRSLPFNEGVVDDGLEYMAQAFSGLRNVLVVPGSIWSWEKVTTRDGPNAAIHNSVPVFYEGKLVHTWNKKNLSSIDGLGDPRRNWGPSTHWDRAKDQQGNPRFETKRSGDADPYLDIQVNGKSLRVGLEVCLDHLLHTLKDKDPGGIDAHLLLCCGISQPSIVPNHIVARPGGLFLRCEGSRDDDDQKKNNTRIFGGTRSNCGVVGSRNLTGVPGNVSSKAHDSTKKRSAGLDERLVIYAETTLTGPS